MLRSYLGARLHRQLFAAFAIAILLSGATVGLVAFAGSNATHWSRQATKVREFAETAYGSIWRDPRARTEVTRSLAHDLDVGVRLTDASGRVLQVERMPPRCRWEEHIQVRDGTRVVGTVSVCLDVHRRHWTDWRKVAAVVCALLALWVFAGLASRRLARPLRELTRVARSIGDGNLASRSRLRHRHGEIGQLSAAVNCMAGRIERQIRSQQELLATVSHELRTPLARVRVLLEMAREKGTPETLVTELEQEVVNMDELVGELLAGARIDFGALELRVLDVPNIAARALERSSHANAKLELLGNAETVRADATLLLRALGALLDNAGKYGGQNVVLRVTSTSEHVRFEVQDDGPGFGAGEEEKIFEPFFRGARAKANEARGVGLGLALVRRIAEAHGGRASARNVPEGGAIVSIDLPRDAQTA